MGHRSGDPEGREVRLEEKGNVTRTPPLTHTHTHTHKHMFLGPRAKSKITGLVMPGLGRSSREGNGNPLQYSCLENPMDREVWWAVVHGVAKSQTRLSD